MCSLLESNLCFDQRMNPFNCLGLQIIFKNLEFKAFFCYFCITLFLLVFSRVSNSTDWTQTCYIARIDLEVLTFLSPHPQWCHESPLPIYERARDQAQGFVCANQVLYHLSDISSYESRFFNVYRRCKDCLTRNSYPLLWDRNKNWHSSSVRYVMTNVQ